MDLTPRVREWSESGRIERAGGHSVFVHTIDDDGPALVLLHGYPSSSYDFRGVLAHLDGYRILTFDFLGYGLSAKPRDHDYSLFGQADLVEELVDRHLQGRPCFVVGHDMGTSVSTELLARDVDGTLRFDLCGALLFNGSIVLERATLTPSQKLLRSRLGPLAARLSNRRVFDQQFGSLFSPRHPLSAEEADDQWSLLCHNGGRHVTHRTIAYLGERIEFAPRWHGAIRDWAGPLSLMWGMHDPVAGPPVLEAVRALRPDAPCEELGDLGHYPQVEDPARVAKVIRAALPIPSESKSL
jgi:pimeloyl-ACP methyl ester carboxylesterase